MGVSVAALAYRLNKLGTLSDWQYRNFCIQINKNYGHTELEEMPRERSIVWEKVFRELWRDRATKDHVAEELGLLGREIEGLIFNMVGSLSSVSALREEGHPKLKLA